jgi:predicted DNA-binding protein with PD1-like motif
MESMKTLPFSLTPGQDLCAALEAAVQAQNCCAAFVLSGCIVLTTAEVLLALLPEWQFTREPDAATGYDELVVRVRDKIELPNTQSGY